MDYLFLKIVLWATLVMQYAAQGVLGMNVTLRIALAAEEVTATTTQKKNARMNSEWQTSHAPRNKNLAQSLSRDISHTMHNGNGFISLGVFAS